MRALALVALIGMALISLAAVAEEGETDPTYGTAGVAPIDAVASSVGVVGLRVSQGAALVSVAADPESGFAVLVSADGAEVSTIPLPGPGLATFDHLGRIVAVSNVEDRVRVTRFDPRGVPDPTFTPGIVGIPGAVWGDVLADSSGIVVAGGVLGPDESAWAARFDHSGVLDSSFGQGGVAVMDGLATGEADLVLANGVHPRDGGYLVVVRASAVGGDTVVVAEVDTSGEVFGSGHALVDISGLYAVESLLLSDGRLLVGTQSSEEDVDTFTLWEFLRPPTLPHGGGPIPHQFRDDEVGGPLRLAELRDGSVLLGYNRGPEPSFVLRRLDPWLVETGDFPAEISDVWMYGMATVDEDGGLLMLVDETPADSIEPDDLSVVKLVGDESGRFIDDDDSVHEGDIEELARRRITLGCNPPGNTRFCPQDAVSREQMAAFLVRALSLPTGAADAFVDDDGSVFEAEIDRLAAAGITRGCDPPANRRFCPESSVTRGQMAAFLVRALGLPGGAPDAFVDDQESVFEDEIDRLAAAGIARGCDPPANTEFCPDQPVTRAQMASFLIRALP